MNKEAINKWSKTIRQEARKHVAWKACVDYLQDHFSKELSKRISKKEIEQCMEYLFDHYDPNIHTDFNYEELQEEEYPNPFWSLIVLDEQGHVKDVVIYETDDLEKAQHFLSGKTTQGEHLWEQQDNNPEPHVLVWLAFFQYDMPKLIEKSRIKLKSIGMQELVEKCSSIKAAHHLDYRLELVRQEDDINFHAFSEIAIRYSASSKYIEFHKLEEKLMRVYLRHHMDVTQVQSFSHVRNLQCSWTEDLQEGAVKSLEQLPNLQSLEINIYSRYKFPNTLMGLPHLHHLTLSGGLHELTPDIENFIELKTLNLYHLKLKSIPASLGQLKSLNQLDLSRNELSELPPSICNLIHLHTLKLSSNVLTEFSFACKLPKLRKLYLTQNNITRIPEEIIDMNLEELYLQENQIHQLPEGIEKIKSLKVLDLSRNPIDQHVILALKEKLSETAVIA